MRDVGYTLYVFHITIPKKGWQLCWWWRWWWEINEKRKTIFVYIYIYIYNYGFLFVLQFWIKIIRFNFSLKLVVCEISVTNRFANLISNLWERAEYLRRYSMDLFRGHWMRFATNFKIYIILIHSFECLISKSFVFFVLNTL